MKQKHKKKPKTHTRTKCTGTFCGCVCVCLDVINKWFMPYMCAAWFVPSNNNPYQSGRVEILTIIIIVHWAKATTRNQFQRMSKQTNETQNKNIYNNKSQMWKRTPCRRIYHLMHFIGPQFCSSLSCFSLLDSVSSSSPCVHYCSARFINLGIINILHFFFVSYLQFASAECFTSHSPYKFNEHKWAVNW